MLELLIEFIVGIECMVRLEVCPTSYPPLGVHELVVLLLDAALFDPAILDA